MLLHSAVAGLGTLGSNSVLKLPKKILAEPQPSEGLTGAARSTSRQSTRVIDKLCQFLSWGPSSWDRDHSPGSSRTPLRWGAFPSEWPERARGRASWCPRLRGWAHTIISAGRSWVHGPPLFNMGGSVQKFEHQEDSWHVCLVPQSSSRGRGMDEGCGGEEDAWMDIKV